MKISNLGFKNVRINQIDEMYPAQDILLKTQQIKQFGSGVYAYDNIPLRVQDKIEEIIKKHFDKQGFIEVEMPLIQQKELWERSGRFQKYVQDGVMLTTKTNKGEYCLAPTAEEALTAFVENRITSHKQLPVSFYQIGKKFRNEIRNRGYLFRGKEFVMLDLYSFDKNEEELMKTYSKVKKTYFDIFNELELELVAVAADNGSIGGKRSEEMMIISKVGEDTILYNKDAKLGLNIEILDRNDSKQYLLDNYNIKDISIFKEEKAMELGHIFALGTKYSESMDINFIDGDNKKIPFSMGCYGIGVSRVLGLLYENNIILENNKIVGFSLPWSVTPYFTYIISSEERFEEALELYNNFLKQGISVVLDDTDNSIGTKIKNAKVLGIPSITILGNKYNEDEFEFEETKNNYKVILNKQKLIENLMNKKIK